MSWWVYSKDKSGKPVLWAIDIDLASAATPIASRSPTAGSPSWATATCASRTSTTPTITPARSSSETRPPRPPAPGSAHAFSAPAPHPFLQTIGVGFTTAPPRLSSIRNNHHTNWRGPNGAGVQRSLREGSWHAREVVRVGAWRRGAGSHGADEKTCCSASRWHPTTPASGRRVRRSVACKQQGESHDRGSR